MAEPMAIGPDWRSALESDDLSDPYDMVFVTGQLTVDGSRSSLAALTPKLHSLLSDIDLSLSRLFVVPDHAKAPVIGERGVLSLRPQVLQQTAVFWRWVADDLGRPEICPESTWLGYRCDVSIDHLPFPVHILGLDSAWLCSGEPDQASVLHAREQLIALAGPLKSKGTPGLGLALMHHSLNDPALMDQEVMRYALDHAAHLLVQGCQLSRQEPVSLWQHALCLFQPEPGLHVLTLHLNERGRPYRIEAGGHALLIGDPPEEEEQPAPMDQTTVVHDPSEPDEALRPNELSPVEGEKETERQAQLRRAMEQIGASRKARGQGAIEEAIAHIEEAIAFFESVGSVRTLAIARRERALALIRQGEVLEAMGILFQCAEVFKQAKKYRSYGAVLLDLSRIQKAENPAGALSLLEEALEVFRLHHCDRERGIALWDIADLKADHHEIDEAIALLQDAEQYLDDADDHGSRVKVLVRLGRLHKEKEEWNEALEVYELVVDLYEMIGDVRGRGRALAALARLHDRAGRLEESTLLLTESLILSRAVDDMEEQCRSLVHLAHIARRQDRDVEVEQMLRQAFELATEHKLLEGIGHAGQGLGTLLMRSGKREEGAEILRTARAALKKLKESSDA